MTTSFAQLKRNTQSQFEKLNEQVKKLSNPQQITPDERFWYPETDKAGNGYAVIRFLPAPAGEDVPFVRLWSHGFKGPGGWYIENSLTTLGQQDPVSEHNAALWATGIEANKQIVREQKRRLNFISNVYVIKDSAHPENEGKVFLFKYGKKIFDKLNAVMNPEFEDETPMNPFDLWEGANFKLKIRKVDDYRNYDKSEFDKPSPLFPDDDNMHEVWKKEYKLQEFVDPKNFKPYDELKARLNKVLGLNSQGKPTGNLAEKLLEDNDIPFETLPKQKTAEAPIIPTETKEAPPWEEDPDLEQFRKLIED